ncbi:MAG: hypothetical protein QMC89_03895 [Candidatus Hodarchaeaceae archaeon]|nr:hypothetical protein [Candidatus Hodarchaeaceae archaeon]
MAVVERGLRKVGITVSKPVLATTCIIFGLLVIIFSELLQWIVGLFLITQGMLILADYMKLKRHQARLTG